MIFNPDRNRDVSKSEVKPDRAKSLDEAGAIAMSYRQDMLRLTSLQQKIDVEEGVVSALKEKISDPRNYHNMEAFKKELVQAQSGLIKLNREWRSLDAKMTRQYGAFSQALKNVDLSSQTELFEDQNHNERE